MSDVRSGVERCEALGNPCGSCGSTEVHDDGRCPTCGPATPPDLLSAPPPDPSTRLVAEAQQTTVTVAAPAAQPAVSAPPASETVASAAVIDEPVPVSAHLAPPAPRPDPYAQIANPLHSEWGQSARPVVPSAAPAATASGAAAPERGRARGVVVFLVVLVAIVAVAALGWFERDRIGDAVDDVRRELDEQTAAPRVLELDHPGPVAPSLE